LIVSDDWTALLSARIIDLSVTVAPELPAAWPLHMPFQAKVWNYFVPLHELQGSIPSSAPYQTRFWVIDEHTGTHFDAPTHFVPPADSGLPWAGPAGAETGDQVPVRDLMGPAVVVDATELAGHCDNGESPWITRSFLEGWEEREGPFAPGDVALLRTGWDRRYLAGSAGDGYSREALIARRGPGWPAPEPAAILFLHERGVRCVGIDAPSIGASHLGAPAHQEGLSRRMRYVEELTGLDQLPTRGAFFLFLGPKVAGATGGPGRAIALLPG
jgi:kynurenine formamidase